MLVEGTSPSTLIRSQIPLHPSLRLWVEHPLREKGKKGPLALASERRAT
jgi:hypothetical protein